MKKFILRQLFIIVPFVLMLVDFVVKTWTFKNIQLGQRIDLIDGFFGLYRTETFGAGYNFYFRALLLLGFLFLLFRIIKMETIPIFKFSIAFTFFGILGNYFDMIAFGFIVGASDFIPGIALNGGISTRYIEALYFNLGFIRTSVSISTLMSNAGLVVFIIAAILKFRELKKLVRYRKLAI